MRLVELIKSPGTVKRRKGLREKVDMVAINRRRLVKAKSSRVEICLEDLVELERGWQIRSQGIKLALESGYVGFSMYWTCRREQRHCFAAKVICDAC